MLISLEGHIVHLAIQFKFKASNNEAKYEALITWASLAFKMKVETLDIYNDSHLVVRQVEGDYQARKDQISLYVSHSKEVLSKFKKYKL